MGRRDMVPADVDQFVILPNAGSYSSSSEVVREALRLMERVEQRELEKLQYLRQAWQQGIDSGDAGEVDFSALKQEARNILASKAL